MAAKSHAGWALIAARGVLGASAFLCACGTLAAPERPALVAEATPASRAELARVVAIALHGAPVTLAADALTTQSALTIERAAPRDAQGRAATGRTLERPVRLVLRLVGDDCVLINEADGQRWRLEQARCVPNEEGGRR
jgi:hypothetical protein